MKNIISILFILLLCISCADRPQLQQQQNSWYQINNNLKFKADKYYESTTAQVNSAGLLIYTKFSPWDESPNGRINYLESHNIADQPAWHGAFMGALAFEWAASGKNRDADLNKLAKGLLKYYEISGQKGLLGRSIIPDYNGPILPWMSTKDIRPSRYWLQGENGYWWRNGLAKGHLTLACFGCAVPLTLHRKGKIRLEKETEKVLKDVLLPAVYRLIDGDFRYQDHNNEFSEFGDLRPNVTFGADWPELPGIPNGFNRVVVLSLLKSAAAYDNSVASIYADKAEEWGPGISISLKLVGEAISKIGHYKINKPSYSDMQLYGLASLLMIMQETDPTILKYVEDGLEGLWSFVKYERNPSFTLPYNMFNSSAGKINEIEEDLRNFPMPKDKYEYTEFKKDTDKIQPLNNRPVNSHYWKSSPYTLLISHTGPVLHPTTNAIKYYSGQDYLLAYWLGRYIKRIPVE